MKNPEIPGESSTTHIDVASPEEAEIIAAMVGELLQEIMTAIDETVFSFRLADTAARARAWLEDGSYVVLLARTHQEAIGFVALYQSYALYAEGIYGTIPELFVRSSHRSQGIGSALLTECMRIGQARGWRRLEVTTPPLPQFDRTLSFYQRHGFAISGGRKMKVDL